MKTYEATSTIEAGPDAIWAILMTWSGGMPLGLFRGVRTFTLSPQGTGSTKFTMREDYTGPLLPLIWRSMPDLGPLFQQFANGLKKRAEAGE